MTEGRYLNAAAVAEYLSVSRNMVDILVQRGALPKPIILTSRLKRWDRLAIDAKLAGASAPSPARPSAAELSRGIADDIIAKGRLSATKDARKRRGGNILPLALDRGTDQG
jgi:predicted DNA-binding transcriptional regulator AlpA